MNFAGGTVINLRALSDEDTHGNHAVFFNDDAFNDFAAGTDKAVVLDDGRGCLKRFENTADTDAAGEIHRGRVPAGSVVVPGSLPSADGKYNLNCAVIVKRVDAKTRSKTSINELLRD